MSDISFVEVGLENLWAVCRLSGTLTKAQQRCVAPNSYSVAEGLLTGADAWFRAVYLGDVPIGFVMVNTGTDQTGPDDGPSVYLWRFMIARPYQRKGYGNAVLDLLVDKFKSEGRSVMYTSCHMGRVSPYKFYISYGFTDTGEIDDDEEVLRLVM
jgi:diamine N-acetyltransferase